MGFDNSIGGGASLVRHPVREPGGGRASTDGGEWMIQQTRRVEQEHQHLKCMEIWGGNRAIDDGVVVPGMTAYVYSRPLADNRTGGDIHYVSTCGGGNIARFALADVAGHGEGANDLASGLRDLMRRNINRLDQTKFIRRLNRAFSVLANDGRFATALLTTYWAPTDHLLVCNAGHPRPLLRREATGEWIYLHHETPERAENVANLPLGVIHPTDYYQFAIKLSPGDVLLMYTDSLPESRDESGTLLGNEGLVEMVYDLEPSDPPTFCRELLKRLTDYRGGQPADDDTTLMILTHTGTRAPGKSIGEMITIVGKMMGLVKI